jgi:hypothetical protein
MNSAQIDAEAAVVGSRIPKGFRVAILGSASFRQERSVRICTSVGELLANLSGLVLITGDVAGAGETVGRAFARGCRNLGWPAKIIHVLPRGCARWDYGATLFAGDEMGERREILGRLAELYVIVEGGPGTEHEARVAAANGSVLVPVGRSGGHAGALFPLLVRPTLAEEHTWRTLSDCEATPPKIAASVLEIVDAYARHAV